MRDNSKEIMVYRVFDTDTEEIELIGFRKDERCEGFDNGFAISIINNYTEINTKDLDEEGDFYLGFFEEDSFVRSNKIYHSLNKLYNQELEERQSSQFEEFSLIMKMFPKELEEMILAFFESNDKYQELFSNPNKLLKFEDDLGKKYYFVDRKKEYEYCKLPSNIYSDFDKLSRLVKEYTDSETPINIEAFTLYILPLMFSY